GAADRLRQSNLRQGCHIALALDAELMLAMSDWRRNMNKRFVATAVVAVSLAAASSHAGNRIQRSGGARSSAATTPVILKRQLSNGLRVWIVEQHDLAVV